MNKKTITKTILACAVAFAAIGAFARPHGGPGGGPRGGGRPPMHGGGGHRAAPPHHGGHHHHHSSSRAFWGGFTGGLVGSLLYSDPVVVSPAPIVVSQTSPVVVTPAPVVVPSATTQVWVEGRYVDVVQPNGTVLRQWVAGHWETR